MVEPSCPALIIHDDDAFRKNLIATLDRRGFTVTFIAPGDDAAKTLDERAFRVVIIGIDLKTRSGVPALDYIREHREKVRCGVIVLGDPDPAMRTYAPWADETFMKPVDPEYLATRARSYCSC
ncbi:MAG TPA: response regulator [Thermoanaerobaculia bacterium]|nr:response regulator [Thermoanaerobaculia bacterium]